jgi:energy-coupling factor transport system permease protein
MKVFRDLTLGQYRPGTSAVHRLDPRVKLGACLLALITVFLPGPVWGVACTWPLLALGLAASRIPLGTFFRGLRPFRWLFVFTCVLHGFTTPGQSLVSIPLELIDLTVEGLVRGGWVSAQLATAIAFSSLLTLATDPLDLIWAFERLASPLARVGIPVGEFCVTILLAIRFLPILGQEAERLTLALRAQGIDTAKGRLTERIRGHTLLLSSLLGQVLRRAETLALDKEMRGWRSGARTTSSQTHGIGRSELMALGVALLSMFAVLGLTRWVSVP